MPSNDHLFISVDIEVRTSGRCAVPLTEEECRNGTYPQAWWTWEGVENSSHSSSGCYVHSNEVYFNKGDGSDCYWYGFTSCLCKKGTDLCDGEPNVVGSISNVHNF